MRREHGRWWALWSRLLCQWPPGLLRVLSDVESAAGVSDKVVKPTRNRPTVHGTVTVAAATLGGKGD